MSARVNITIDGHVATVRLTRPEKLNALDAPMFAELAIAGEDLKRNKEVRAVVLHGEGDHFCAGIDISSLQGLLADNVEFRRRALSVPPGEVANEFQKCVHVWREIDVPVIAAIKGVAFGGGCQIALAADLRIAAPGARLSIMEVKWGLVPDMAIMAVLPRLMKIDVAKELIWSGRIVEAREALEIGLVTSIQDDPVAHAHELARQIAARSPDAIQAGKRLLEDGWGEGPSVALRLEAEFQARIIGMPNQLEAVAANLEKRSPRFD